MCFSIHKYPTYSNTAFDTIIAHSAALESISCSDSGAQLGPAVGEAMKRRRQATNDEGIELSGERARLKLRDLARRALPRAPTSYPDDKVTASTSVYATTVSVFFTSSERDL